VNPADSVWIALAERDPRRLAVAVGEDRHTVAQLTAAARSLAAELADAGVQAGDRVVVGLPSSFRIVAMHLALRLCGAAVVNVPWQWRRELVGVVESSRLDS